MFRLTGHLFDRLVTFCAILAGLLLVAQMIAVCADVFTRFAFNKPIDGVNALTEWSLVYIAFLGAAWLQRENGHVRVDMLIFALPPAPAKVLIVIGILIGLAVTAIVSLYATRVTWVKFIEQEYDFFKLAWMPIWVIYVVIPFGALLWFFQLCRDLASEFLKPHHDSSNRQIGD